MPEFKHLENDGDRGLPLFSTSQGWPVRKSDKYKPKSIRKASRLQMAAKQIARKHKVKLRHG